MSSFELPALLKLLFLLAISSAPGENPEAPSKAFQVELPGAVQVTADFEQMRHLAAENEVVADFLKMVGETGAETKNFEFPGMSAEFIQNSAKSIRRAKLFFFSYLTYTSGEVVSDSSLNSIFQTFWNASSSSPWLICVDGLKLDENQVKACVEVGQKNTVFSDSEFDGVGLKAFRLNGLEYCFLNIDDTFIFCNSFALLQKYLYTMKSSVLSDSENDKKSLVALKAPPLLLSRYFLHAGSTTDGGLFGDDGATVKTDSRLYNLLSMKGVAVAESSEIDIGLDSITLSLRGIPARLIGFEVDFTGMDFSGFILKEKKNVTAVASSGEKGNIEETVDLIFEKKFGVEKILQGYIDTWNKNRLARLRTESRDRLEMLGLAFHRYLIKNNKVCPETLDEVVRYVDLIGEKALFCPMNDKKFVFNERTSGKSYQELLEGDNFDRILVHTPVGADPMGGHILYISGTVRFVSATQLDVISRGLKGELNPGEDPDVF